MRAIVAGEALAKLPLIELTLLIGQYAQRHFLGRRRKASLAETMKAGRNTRLATFRCLILRHAIRLGCSVIPGLNRSSCPSCAGGSMRFLCAQVVYIATPARARFSPRLRRVYSSGGRARSAPPTCRGERRCALRRGYVPPRCRGCTARRRSAPDGSATTAPRRT